MSLVSRAGVLPFEIMNFLWMDGCIMVESNDDGDAEYYRGSEIECIDDYDSAEWETSITDTVKRCMNKV